MAKEVPGKRHEIIGVIVLSATALLALCLASYDAHDSSFNALFYKASATNKAGRLGAWVSDILYQVFGFPAVLLLIPMVIAGWKLIRGRSIRAPYARAFGLLLLMGGTGTALQLLPVKLSEINFAPGGMTGVLLSEALLANLNRTGTIIVVAGALILGFLAATTFSLQQLFERATRDQESARPGLWARFKGWRARHKPVRTVVNIKPAAAQVIELTPRPAPVHQAAAQAKVEPKIQPVVKPVEPDPARPAPAGDKAARVRRFVLPPVELLPSRTGTWRSRRPN